jgi:hypothetical protein
MGGGAPMMMMGMGMGGPMMGGGPGAPPGAMMMMPQQAQAQAQAQMNIPPLPMPEGEMVEKIGQAISNRLHNMKSSYKMFQDFLKLAINYTQALQTSSGCGRQMAAVLKKVSTGQGQPDIAAGYRALAELQHSTESRADAVIKAMQDDLLSSAQNVLTGGFKETCRFEQGFNQGYIKARSEILALPPNSIQRNQKLRDVEDKLANNLEILRGLERKVYCVPEDHEILTSRGFLDLDAYKAAVAADPTLLVASYNVAAKALVFEKPNKLVQFAAETRELVELSNMQNAWSADSDSQVSMLVTKEHDVFAQLGNALVDENGTTTVTPDSSYAKHQAGDLLKSEFNVVGQLAVAEAGVQGETVPDFCDELGLSTPKQRALFYEIYGFWLGDGSLRWHGQEFAVTFVEEAWLEESLTALEVPYTKSDASQTGQATISIQSDAWNRVFAAEYQHMYERADAVAKRAKTELTTEVDAEGRAFDTVSTAKGSYMQPEGIAKWFACWVWRLGAASLRRVLAGLCRADGDATKNRCIWTSSARFRDEIQRVCLMAGCTAHFRCAGGSSWAVSFAEPDGSPSSENACKPNLFKARGEIRTRQHTGRVWCFNMPSGFIWVRRVAKDEHGVVTEASRPLITGNCNFLLLWTAVLDAQAAAYRAAADAYGGAQKQWTQLAVSGDRIAPEPVDYKKVLADRRGEVYNGNPAQMQMQMQQQQQQQMAFQQQQMMMRQSGVAGGGGMMPPQQQMQMRQPGAIGAHWGGGPPPNMMMQQNFMPKGVPELPENMRGARLELQQQYKKIPKFDDLDESGLDAWELPDVQFDQSGRDRGSSMSMSTSEDSMRGSFGGSARASAAPAMGGGGGGVAGGARARNSSVAPAAAMGSAKSPPTARKLAPDVVCMAKALYAYKANNDDEHSFAAGEVFEVISKDSENWWTGRNPANGLTLLLPSNYMKEE